jgi:hypothetical protein
MPFDPIGNGARLACTGSNPRAVASHGEQSRARECRPQLVERGEGHVVPVVRGAKPIGEPVSYGRRRRFVGSGRVE